MLLLLAAVLATSQQLELPAPPRGYGTSAAEVVVDAARVLDAGTIDRINRIAFAVREATGGEMAVVTMPSLGGRPIEDVALRIGREWGVGGQAPVGDQRRNAGVVVLLAPTERQVRIETGRGVEGFVTDGEAGDIHRAATPYFARQDYGGGMVMIVSELADRYAREFGVILDTSLVQTREMPRGTTSRGPSIGAIIFLLFVMFLIFSGMGGGGRGGRRYGRDNGMLDLLLWAALSQSRGRRRGGWGGGGFGGGSFGGGGGFGGFGGGGGFSGGGSTGSW